MSQIVLDLKQEESNFQKQLKVHLGDWWYEKLKDKVEGWKNPLFERLKLEYDKYIIYPKKDKVFRALRLTPNPKVVIIGQCPYHNINANGIAFDCELFPSTSMKAILRALGKEDLLEYPLKHWTEQGVLLLNTALTVRKGQAGSHSNIGWKKVIYDIISVLDKKPIVFMLWGSDAQKYEKIINPSAYKIIDIHPQVANYNSKLEFKGGFKECNEYLSNQNLTKINW